MHTLQKFINMIISKGASLRTSAVSIIEPWLLPSLFHYNPEKFMEGVPAMPITVTCSDFHYGKKLERIADQLNHGNCLQDAQALVHRVLSKKEIKEDPKQVKPSRRRRTKFVPWGCGMTAQFVNWKLEKVGKTIRGKGPYS